jgi:hypothetical protein
MVFPGGSPAALGFRGAYLPLDTLACGEGFWLRDVSDVTQEVCGDTVAGADIPVRAGWNLVAPFHRPVPVRNISTTPPDILSSGFLGFTGSYATVYILQPGLAYWVRARAEGVMHLGTTPIKTGLP